MGVLLTKPITKDDLTEIKDDLTEIIDAKFAKIDANINTKIDAKFAKFDAKFAKFDAKFAKFDAKLQPLFDDLLAPSARNLAEKATCSVTKGLKDKPDGHGLIVKRKEMSQTRFFFLTAAHVAIELVSGGDPTCHLKFFQKNSFQVKLGDIYITEKYVLDGSHDIACIEIVGDWGQSSAYTDELNFGTGEGIVGKAVVAQGNMFIRGPVLHDEDTRVLIQAPSAPGCSGSPLFSNEEKIVAILHGSGKHRGKHNATSDGMSPHVFGDTFDKVELRRVDALHKQSSDCENKTKAELLSMAEDIPEDIAANPGIDIPEGSLKELREIFKESTLEKLMTKMHLSIWSEGEDTAYLPLTNLEYCYFQSSTSK